jgi:hypothetical protein
MLHNTAGSKLLWRWKAEDDAQWEKETEKGGFHDRTTHQAIPICCMYTMSQASARRDHTHTHTREYRQNVKPGDRKALIWFTCSFSCSQPDRLICTQLSFAIFRHRGTHHYAAADSSDRIRGFGERLMAARIGVGWSQSSSSQHHIDRPAGDENSEADDLVRHRHEPRPFLKGTMHATGKGKRKKRKLLVAYTVS